MAGTVVVACKITNGLILRLFEMADTPEVHPNGFRTIQKARQKGDPVKIAGYAHDIMHVPKAPISGGYALTTGVDADFWEEWLDQNRDADYVRNGLIFAHEKSADVRAQAKEYRARPDNQGPIVPDSDPRIPKRKNRDGKVVSAVQTEGTVGEGEED